MLRCACAAGLRRAGCALCDQELLAPVAHGSRGVFICVALTLAVFAHSHKTSSALRPYPSPIKLPVPGDRRPPRCVPAASRPGRPRNREEAGSPCRSLIKRLVTAAPAICLSDRGMYCARRCGGGGPNCYSIGRVFGCVGPSSQCDRSPCRLAHALAAAGVGLVAGSGCRSARRHVPTISEI
jgi:hypothetical protein